MAQTAIEKIVQRHMVDGPRRDVRAGDFVSLRPRHVLTHDNTSAVIKKFSVIGAERIFDPRQPVFALDHDIQNHDATNLKKYFDIENFAAIHGIDFYAAGSGIGHQMMIENGYVLPGSLVVASDSHSNMYGALGALGTPVVRTDAAAIWAIGEFWWQVPATVRVVLRGKLRPGVSGKDVILALCGIYNHEEVLNKVLEFAGDGTASLSIDKRLTIANMSTEWGALAAWFPADAKTFAYLRKRAEILGDNDRLNEGMLSQLERERLVSDAGANFEAQIELDLESVVPYVSGPDTLQVTQSLAEIAPKKIAIHKAYLLSCVNSRVEDLEAAASVLEGKSIAPGVKLYIAAASAHEQAVAEAKDIWATLLSAGAIALPPSCGPCIGLGTGLLDAGEVGISATNRNFKGRMGSRDAKCYLASPAVVAASAVSGYITGPLEYEIPEFERNYRVFDLPRIAAESVSILEGFPAKVIGRAVFCPQDNLNTDGIYSKDYTYREDVTPELMARVVMENYDPQFASRTKPGDVLIGGFNFGTGSSREQAVTALQAKRIALLIAGSFSQTYLRNAFNNGYLCIECPALVQQLKREFEAQVAENQRTIIPGDQIEMDFATCTLRYRDRSYTFPAMGAVPQSLVIAGGIENLVTQRLKSAEHIEVAAVTGSRS
jgi:homoaconitate hydratase